MPSDDTPLKLQSGEEFPTEKWKVDIVKTSSERWAAYRKMPNNACQNLIIITAKRRVHLSGLNPEGGIKAYAQKS
jgi:hypothetical protein